MNAERKRMEEQAIGTRNLTKQSSGITLQREGLLSRMKKNKLFYISIAPFFVLFLVFNAFPIIVSFFLGFTDWKGIGVPEYVGVDNYVRLFRDPVFLKSLYNTLYIWFFSTILTLSLAFILAYLVNQYIHRAKGFFRIVFLFPLLVAPALTAIMISVIFSTNSGLVNTIISFFVEGTFNYEWLRSTIWVKPLIVLIIIWRWTGYHFILFYAGLQTIPNELYDAAKIDGASGGKIIKNITLPLMLPIILVSVVTATVGGIQLFDEPYVLTQGTGGINNTGLSMGMYLYQTAFEYFEFGLAAAQSYVLFAIILVTTLINAKFLQKRT